MYKAAYSVLLALLIFFPTFAVGQRITPGEVLFRTNTTLTRPVPIPGIDSVEPLLHTHPFSKPAVSISRIYKASISPGHTIDDVLDRLRSRPDVEYAQPNHLFETFQVTDDPRRPEQFHLDQINWPALVSALPEKQRDVIVGIIDSGIDADHEDLADRVWVNSAEVNGITGIDDDGNGYVDDVRGWDFTDAPTLPGQGDFVEPDNDPSDESSHGTQVAGVIGAIAGNGIGVAGIADCTLMAIRAGLTFDQGGTFLQEDDLAAAIIYAVDNGAHILNLSWGSFDRAFVIEDAVRYAVDRGVVVVAAAGNSGEPPVAYPAALDDVISVSAVETSGQLASFSSYGPVLDLVAPGVNIVSTRPDDAYGPRSGSSFAAPQIAGLAALLLSRQPDLTPGQVRSALVSATTDLGDTGWDFSFGAGQIDASALIDVVNGATPATAAILSPGNDQDAADIVPITVSTSGNLSTYRLSWSPNVSPPVWTSVDSGTPSSSFTSDWVVPEGLADTSIVLRLETDVPGASLPLEHRVRLRASPSSPVLSSLFYGPILEGAEIAWRVRWVTRHASKGRLVLIHPNGIERDTIGTHKLDRFHEVRIPDRSTPDNFTFQLILETESGVRTVTDPESILIVPARLPTIGFTEIATLPDAFLPDHTSDFDGDGRLEIALMPYVEGEAFSPVEIFEYSDQGFTGIHTTDEGFLPWNVGDVTHDGRPDLLGSSVARVRLLTGSSLPTDVVLDQSGVWGGVIADADGDGANEILTRSLVDRSIRLFRAPAGGAFLEFATLPDPSGGSGEIGSRFVVGDLDGDFRQDILVGDGDGDLWSYEFVSGSFQPDLLIEGSDDTDARIVGGGEDLDGDGLREFVVARAFEDPADPLNGWWDLEIYEVDGAEVRTEWVQRISGVATPGNGISTGDLDGDGRSDLAVALIPDLYVIRADAPNTYRPIYHTDISLTYRPLISDLDADGKAEIVFNADSAVRVYERDLGTDTDPRPEILQALSVTANRIQLSWMPTPSAQTYRLFRTLNGETAVILEAPVLSHVDESITSGDTLVYHVEAQLDTSFVRSSPVTVVAGTGPTVISVDRVDDHRIAVLFSVPMADAAAAPDGYRLHPQSAAPTSAIRDQGSRRILLKFQAPIPDGVTHTLVISSAVDLAGRPLVDLSREVTFTPGFQSTSARSDFDSDGTVGFGDFLLFAAAFGGTDATFDLDNDGLVGFSDFLLFASVFGLPA